jgi:hypothetical protein
MLKAGVFVKVSIKLLAITKTLAYYTKEFIVAVEFAVTGCGLKLTK